MNKEQQDLAWKCLPKGMRKEIEDVFYYKATSANTIDNGFSDALEYLYGKHNLTSDTEPEEMLMVERKRVIEIYNPEYDGETLYELFGDKCLPEKEEPKPKFKAGDEVWYGVNKCTINKIEGNTAYIVYNNGASWENISQLRPYIEPNYKFGIGDKVKFRNSKIKIVRRRFASPYDNEAHYSVETLDGQSPINVVESDLEPYTEEKTMEEVKDYPPYLDRPKTVVSNDLNLCELLKGCEREEFYLLDCGNAILDGVQTNNSRGDSITFLSLHSTNFDSGTIIINPNGKRTVHGSVILYPSRALYEKYPLDARAAWMEWKESRKPKYILQAEIRLISLDGRDVEDWEQIEIIGVPDIDLSQAAEVVRDTLVKFHSKVAQSK